VPAATPAARQRHRALFARKIPERAQRRITPPPAVIRYTLVKAMRNARSARAAAHKRLTFDTARDPSCRRLYATPARRNEYAECRAFFITRTPNAASMPHFRVPQHADVTVAQAAGVTA